MNADKNLLIRITREFERVVPRYLEMSERLAEGAIVVAAVRDPALYGNVAEGVKLGQLIPKITVTRGVVKICLTIAAVREDSPPLYEYPTKGG